MSGITSSIEVYIKSWAKNFFWFSNEQEVTSFKLNGENLNKLKRAAGVIQAPDLVLEKNNTDVFLTVKDKKNDTANTFSIDVDTVADGSDFNFFFKVENLKLMDGNYDVDISSKNISHLKSTNKDIEYWVALEPESSCEW